MLKRTPFYDFHVSAGAKLVDFAGWEMPILYRGIVEEHEQTRRSGSVFDVSHMGRLYLTGPDALPLLDKVMTRRLSDQSVGQSRYSLVCNEAGSILDDVIVSRDTDRWLVVCNASNRDKIVSHLDAVRHAGGLNVELSDQTEYTAMLAIQGPRVIELLSRSLPVDPASLKRYHFETTEVFLTPISIFRSGYTGEDGVEVILPASAAAMALPMIAGRLTQADGPIRPAGLGARDTLRLEAGMPLYRHELSESIDPLSAGLGWAVDLSKPFIGAPALRQIQQNGPRQRLVGLILDSKRIARQGTPVRAADAVVGTVTSGTFSPTLQQSIAMAFVESSHAAEGTTLQVDLKGTLCPARIVKLPFYKRSA